METQGHSGHNRLSEWELPEATRDMYDSPTTLFQLFIIDEIIDQICKEMNSYIAQKGNRPFRLDPKEFKSLIVVLLLSDNIPYPRYSMYWKMTKTAKIPL